MFWTIGSKHLPTAVMFVIDPTDSAGDKSSLVAQVVC